MNTKIDDFQLLRQQTLLNGKRALAGKCNGKFNLTEVDAEFLQNLLPDALTLGPQTYTKEGRHPLLLMFNDTYLHNAHFPVPLHLHYNEFVVMIPFVSFKEKKFNEEPAYCFLPVLYLDDLRAVLGGRIFWDFNKELADFTVSSTSFEVGRWNSLFSSSFNISSDPVLGTSVPNFRAIIPILQLTVIEHGFFSFMSCRYEIEYENATIRPIVSTTHNLSCKYLPTYATIVVPSILDSPLGGFMMQYNWSLTYLKPISL